MRNPEDPLTLHRSISTFYIDEYFSFSMRFQDTLEDVKVSLGYINTSEFIIRLSKRIKHKKGSILFIYKKYNKI